MRWSVMCHPYPSILYTPFGGGLDAFGLGTITNCLTAKTLVFQSPDMSAHCQALVAVQCALMQMHTQMLVIAVHVSFVKLLCGNVQSCF